MKRLVAKLRKPYFWAIAAIFLAGVLLHYFQYLPFAVSGPDTLLGLEHHSIGRVVFLGAIILGGVVSGFAGGMFYLILSVLAMLPYVFLPSNFSADAVYEIFLVIIIGFGFNYGLATHRREIGKREQVFYFLRIFRDIRNFML